MFGVIYLFHVVLIKQQNLYCAIGTAFWRIYEFPIHSRKPNIEKLPCHLLDEQPIIYEEGGAEAAAEQGPPETKLMAWFRLNQTDEDAHHILYPDIPKYTTCGTPAKRHGRQRRAANSTRTTCS